MSKGIRTDNDASVWAVIMPNQRGVGNGYETVMCATERDALVYAWFHNEPRAGTAQIIEMALMRVEPWNDRGERVRSKGISIQRRRRS